MARKRSFPKALIDELQAFHVVGVLELLGVCWKRDPDYSPTKDKATARLYVSIGGGVVELLATGTKWYDVREKVGGGGAIDLVMHLFKVDFVSAVKQLREAKAVGGV